MMEILNIKELYFIKCSKKGIEEKCKKAMQEYDFSDIFNGKFVKAWIEKNGTSNLLYIASPSAIYFPKDSSDLFSNFKIKTISLKNIEKLQFDNINTSKVVDMSYMFSNLEFLTNIDLSNFTFNPNLRTAYRMFKECKSIEILDIRNIAFSNVNKKIYCYDYIKKSKIYPKYYGMFEDLYDDIKIIVKDIEEKNNVLNISLNYLRDENINIEC